MTCSCLLKCSDAGRYTVLDLQVDGQLRYSEDQNKWWCLSNISGGIYLPSSGVYEYSSRVMGLPKREVPDDMLMFTALL